MQKERPGWQLNRAKSLKKPHQETAGETRHPRLLPQLRIKGSRTLRPRLRAPLVRPWMSRCLGLPRGPISRPGNARPAMNSRRRISISPVPLWQPTVLAAGWERAWEQAGSAHRGCGIIITQPAARARPLPSGRASPMRPYRAASGCGPGHEVAPLLWRPHCLGFWSPQWQRSTHLTRRNSAGR
jgi:hypothetical protein